MTHFTTHSLKPADAVNVTRNDSVVTWELNRPEQDNGLDGELLKTCFGNASIFPKVVGCLNELPDRLEVLPLISIACI